MLMLVTMAVQFQPRTWTSLPMLESSWKITTPIPCVLHPGLPFSQVSLRAQVIIKVNLSDRVAISTALEKNIKTNHVHFGRYKKKVFCDLF